MRYGIKGKFRVRLKCDIVWRLVQMVYMARGKCMLHQYAGETAV